MNAQKIVSLLLLLFLIASVGTIVAKETGSTAPMTAPEFLSTPSVEENPSKASVENKDFAKVVAFYFYGNVRCTTCRTMQTLATEAIETGFADEIKNGRLQMISINVDEPGNEHYVNDYQLTTRAVVLARFEGTTQKEWKNLDKIWNLVRNRPAFIEYVQTETTHILNGKTL